MTTNPTTLAARLREIPHHDLADRKVRNEAAALIEQQQADNDELATRLRAAEAKGLSVTNAAGVLMLDIKKAEADRDTYKARAEAAETLIDDIRAEWGDPDLMAWINLRTSTPTPTPATGQETTR